MNTKQKLTLGIAAIFMVTLTIVGITYAYFVTTVRGNTLENNVNVQTASVGEVTYVPGNGTGDVITLSDVLPGETKYKTFSVTNGAAAGSGSSIYGVYYTSTPGAPQFVHATDDSTCYQSADLVRSNETGATAEPCFNGTSYNNIYVTLYTVDAATYAKVNADGTLQDGTTLPTATVPEANVVATAGINTTTATQNMTSNVSIAGQDTHYYILKVEYRDNHLNQNIENEAELSIKVNIN